MCRKSWRRAISTRGAIIEKDSSPYLAMAQAGIPSAVIVEMIRIFSYNVDFQREVHPGDSFEVLAQ